MPAETINRAALPFRGIPLLAIGYALVPQCS